MTLRSRTDTNQTRLVKLLRQRGWLVLHMHTLRSGAPDLLGLFKGKLVMIEVKDGRKRPSKRRLTAEQLAFHQEWKDAPLYIVENEADIERIEQEITI